MDNLFGLSIVLDFTDNASSRMLGTQRIFDGMHRTSEELTEAIDRNARAFQQLSMVGLGISATGLGFKLAGDKITGTITKMADVSGEFERAMAELQFVTGATGEEFEKLRQTAIQTGIDTAFSPKEATQAMYELKSYGLSTDATLKSLQSTLDIVALSAGKIDLASGASLMGSALNKFNLEASESGRVADIFAKATQDTAFHIEEIGHFINALGSAPTKLQRPIEEFFAMGGLLRNIGQQSAQAGATVQGFGRQILMLTSQMESGSMEGKKADALSLIGLSRESFWNAEGELRGMSEIFKEIIEGTASLTQEQKASAFQTIFGDQAGNLLSAVEMSQQAFYKYDEASGTYIQANKEGKKSLDDLINGFQSVDGEAKKGAEALLNTYEGIKILQKGSEETFQILMGQTVLPVLGKFIQLKTMLLNKIIAIVNEHPKIAKFLTTFALLAGVGIALVGTLLIVVGGVLALVGAIGSGITALQSFAVFLGASGVHMASAGAMVSFLQAKFIGFATIVKAQLLSMLAPLLGLVATIGVLYLAWKYDFANIRTMVTGFYDNTKWAFNTAKSILEMNAEDMSVALADLEKSGKHSFFTGLVTSIVKVASFVDILKDAWDFELSDENFAKANELGILPLINKILDLKLTAESVWNGFVEGFTWVGDTVVTLGGGIIDTIENIAGWIDSWIPKNETLEGTMGEVNDTAGQLNTEKWEHFGTVIGILAGAFATHKIATTVWGIISAVKGMAVALAGTTAAVWGHVTALGALFVAQVRDKLETMAIIALYAKDALLRAGLAIKNGILTATQWALNVAMSANPVGLIILGIGALIGIIVLLIKSWDKVKETVKTVIDSILGWIQPFTDAVSNVVGKLKSLFGFDNKEVNVKVNETKNGETSNVTGLATGGYTEGEGLAFLHQNEVVVNDELTQQLRGFLSEREQAPLEQVPTQFNVTMPNSTGTDRIENYNKSIANSSSRTSNDNRVIFEQGSIQVNATGDLQYDVDELFEKFKDKIERDKDLKGMQSYSFA